MVTCRRAGAADEADVLRLMQDFYAEEHLVYGSHCAAALRALLTDGAAGEVHLLKRQGVAAPIGYFVLTWCFSVERGGKMALLDELYVMPSARGQGAGKRAIGAAAEAARAAGCRAVVLEVDQHNERARRLYQQAGYQALGRECLCLNIQ